MNEILDTEPLVAGITKQ